MNARLERLLKASKVMRVIEASDVLDVSRSAVERAVRLGKIGAEQIHVRNDHGAKRERMTITLSRGAVLRFIVRTTTGDEREELLRDIELHAPAFLEMAVRAVKAEDPPASLREALRAGESQASTPKNVIPFKRGQRRHADPAPGHPDLFAEQTA